MSQSFETAVARLNNIETIKPLLSAMRTLSMGAWHMALNKLSAMIPYEENFDRILFEVLRHLDVNEVTKNQPINREPGQGKTIILIIGSERGLCGKYNTVLAENSTTWIESQNLANYQVWAIGSKLIRTLEGMKIAITQQTPVPAGGLLSYSESYITTQNWLDQYEAYAFDQFFIHYNEIKKGGLYEFATFHLLPYQSPQVSTEADSIKSSWPPPIIESDPLRMYRQIIEHYVASSYYKILLSSSAAENSSRYRLMQEAEENAEEIIEELTFVINAERKRKITQEMQELAAGSGLLNRQ